MATLSLSTAMPVRWTRQIMDSTEFRRLSNVPGPAARHTACTSCPTRNTRRRVACRRVLSALAPDSWVLGLLQRSCVTLRRDQTRTDRQRRGSRTPALSSVSQMEETSYPPQPTSDARQARRAARATTPARRPHSLLGRLPLAARLRGESPSRWHPKPRPGRCRTRQTSASPRSTLTAAASKTSLSRRV